MSLIFVSYSRESKVAVQALVEDIESLGHNVWFDDDTSGGQDWWDQVLSKVRECDVFIFALTPRSLNSTACKREYRYAADLDKSIIPVLVADGVSINLLPPALSVIQYVDYRSKDDRDAAFRLARAFNAVPPLKPLPDPLPDPPDVPISYLGGLTEQISATSTILSSEEQTNLLVELRRSLRDPETAEDGAVLLMVLRKRRDLLASTAEDIDELLAQLPKHLSSSPAAPESRKTKIQDAKEEDYRQKIDEPQSKAKESSTDKPTNKVTTEERITGARYGAIIGTVVGVIAMAPQIPGEGVGVLYFGAPALFGASIAGAISGKSRSVARAAMVTGIIGWFIGAIVSFNLDAGGFDDAMSLGGITFAPIGAIVGAIIGVVLKKKYGWN